MSRQFGSRHQPPEIRLKRDEKVLEVDLDDVRTLLDDALSGRP